jgi:hypothetical protein
MKTPLEELMYYMEQNQYFIGNDLLAKYKELLEKEKEVIMNAFIEANVQEGRFTHLNKVYAEYYYNDLFEK